MSDNPSKKSSPESKSTEPKKKSAPESPPATPLHLRTESRNDSCDWDK